MLSAQKGIADMYDISGITGNVINCTSRHNLGESVEINILHLGAHEDAIHLNIQEEKTGKQYLMVGSVRNSHLNSLTSPVRCLCMQQMLLFLGLIVILKTKYAGKKCLK